MLLEELLHPYKPKLAYTGSFDIDEYVRQIRSTYFRHNDPPKTVGILSTIDGDYKNNLKIRKCMITLRNVEFSSGNSKRKELSQNIINCKSIRDIRDVIVGANIVTIVEMTHQNMTILSSVDTGGNFSIGSYFDVDVRYQYGDIVVKFITDIPRLKLKGGTDCFVIRKSEETKKLYTRIKLTS